MGILRRGSVDDIVERLRDYPNNRGHTFMREAAANEIEKLRKELIRARRLAFEYGLKAQKALIND